VIELEGEARVKPLTAMEIQAVDHYVSTPGCSKGQAMRVAGYSRTVTDNPQKMFNKPNVAAEVRRRREIMARRAEVTEERIVAEYARIAFGSIAKFKKVDFNGGLYWDFTGATEEDLELIEAMDTETYVDGRGEESRIVKKLKIKPYPKLQALDALARHLGLFKDSVNVTHEVTLVDRMTRGRERVFSQQVIEGQAEKVEDA